MFTTSHWHVNPACNQSGKSLFCKVMLKSKSTRKRWLINCKSLPFLVGCVVPMWPWKCVAMANSFWYGYPKENWFDLLVFWRMCSIVIHTAQPPWGIRLFAICLHRWRPYLNIANQILHIAEISAGYNMLSRQWHWARLQPATQHKCHRLWTTT